MTTDPHDEHGEILRRALHAEADKVEPAPDGLERIRAGIEQRSRKRLSGLYGWVPARYWLPGGWSRPLLAAGAAAAILAIGVSAPQTIDRIASAGRQGPAGGDGRPAATTGQGTAGQIGQQPLAPGPGQSAAPTPGQPATSPVPGLPGIPTCTPTGRPSPEETPEPAGTQAPQPTQTPCPEPSDPSSSPEPSGPSSPEPSGPQTPSGDPTSAPPTTAPEQTEGP